MDYKIKQLFVLILFFFTLVSLQGQNTADFKLPEIIPLSPEVKGIGKYGDVPVGTYTGTPDISIPIYTVKAGTLSLPITMNYHATGIEVAQEASWVGLGWNLMAGGSISYIQVGGDDRSNYSLSYTEFQDLIRFMGNSSTSTEGGQVGFSCSSPDVASQWVKAHMLPALLGGLEQRDVYSASFGNYSFKFIKNPLYGIIENNQYDFLPYDQYVLMGQKNKCKIEDCSINDIDHGFVITGEDGTVFHFEVIETNLATKASSWVLTKMISPNGDTMIFKYKKIGITSLPTLSELYTIKDDITLLPQRIVTGNLERYVPYLDTIETKNELIIFDSDLTRSDVIGGCRLKKITIKDKINQVEKFSYRFVYSYFIGDSIGGDFLSEEELYKNNSTYSESVKRNRLKLDSIVQCSNDLTNEKYAFSYYVGTLPYKTSFAVDHWGYYNGKENSSQIIDGKQHTLIPNALPLVLGNPVKYGGIENRFFSLQGAIRGASKDSTIYTAGMLKSIQYPTKGKTVFTYEPHDFINYNYVSAEDENNINSPTTAFPKTATVQAWGNTPYPVTSVTQVEFTLEVKSSVTFYGYTDFADGTITISLGPTDVFIRQGWNPTNTNGHIAEWTEYLWLEPGTYTLRCTAPWAYINSSDMLPEIKAQVTYNYDNQAGWGINSERCSTCSYIGGGLRIKKIVNYDETNMVLSSKRYSYTAEDDSSSGQLLIPLQNISKKDIIHRQCSQGYEPNPTWVIHSSTLYGSSYVSLSGYLTGNNVGYDRVVVESYNKNSSNGKEINYFENIPGTLFLGRIPFFSVWNNAKPVKNGNLAEKVILDANGDTILTEKNKYCLLSGIYYEYPLNVFAEDHYEGPLGGCPGCPAIENRLMLYKYPTQNFYNALSEKETTHYFPNGKVKEIANYTHNPENYRLKSSVTSTSVANSNKITEFKYPNDFASVHPYDTMIMRNMITPVVEQTDKIDYTTLQTTTTNYKGWGNNIIAPESVVTKRNDQPDTRIRYKYDKWSGNLMEASKENDAKTCYLWGYNQELPIAKIENASYKGSYVTYTGNMDLSLQQFESSTQYSLSGSCTIPEAATGTITRTYGKPSTYGAMYTTNIYNSSGAFVTNFIDGLSKNETSRAFSSPFSLPVGIYTAKVTVTFSDATGVTSFPGGVSVSINASNGRDAGAPYYNSFEEDVSDFSTIYARTGNKSHPGIFTFTMPTISGQSIFSYWKKQDTSSPWVKVEELITAGGQSISIGAIDTYIDEIRVYPEGSLMTTYTYDPVYGMTSSTDANNVTIYYKYDDFGRLKLAKDDDGNILKTYEYHYKE